MTLSALSLVRTPLPGLQVLQRRRTGDHRGYFERLFCAEELAAVLADRRIVQVNHSVTAERGTVRGLHFQRPPHAEVKIVSCLHGEVFDVAVDLRRNSPTFLQWHGEALSPENGRALLIPEGFAHGFQACTDACELLYFHTASYAPSAEGGLHSQDPRLAIQWPFPIRNLSPRDQSHPWLGDEFDGVM